MRSVLLGAALLIACGSSIRETCDLAARPGTWRITTTFDHTYFSPPVPCPDVQLTVTLPTSTGDYAASVLFDPASSELGSIDECRISYVQGSPEDAAGRTGCGGFFEAGSGMRTTGECIVDFGPANSYGDSSSFCYYNATWERLN
jgi:hypothetical protein